MTELSLCTLQGGPSYKLSDFCRGALVLLAPQVPRNEHVPTPIKWTKVFPEPRLCKAIVDRLTFNAHIIETGTESWRFKKTMKRQQRKGVRRKTA
jgi:hypothetical protein